MECQRGKVDDEWLCILTGSDEWTGNGSLRFARGGQQYHGRDTVKGPRLGQPPTDGFMKYAGGALNLVKRKDLGWSHPIECLPLPFQLWGMVSTN
ncbi:hypothetical protein RUM44_007930 [Polyplax serrata]|uniref:Uncharacterized protein n=1 Tax=Polyplax serrata TaxID=468196 RepID=A0ABR1BBB3_POLSC